MAWSAHACAYYTEQGVESPPDASTGSDAGPAVNDATVEASADTGATPDPNAVGRGCAGRNPMPKLCFDFESGLPPSLELRTEGCESLVVPNAEGGSYMRSSCTFAGEARVGYAETQLPPLVRVAWSGDLLLESIGSEPTEVAHVRLNDEQHLLFTVDTDALSLRLYNEAGSETVLGKVPKPRPQTWMNIGMVVSLIKGTVTAHVGDETIDATMPFASSSPNVKVAFGVTFSRGYAAVVGFDNVAIDYE